MTGGKVHFHALPRDEFAAAVSMPAPLSPISAQAARDLAVALAYTGVGRVSPNPLVGAVIVDREHRFVAAGAHRQVGGAHAEVDAFEAAAALHGASGRSGEIYRGGTIYVTLEPCAHQGRTPACAPRVATSGLARCVFGTLDPNPLVAGKGEALLVASGVQAVCDTSWQPACERLAEFFLHDMSLQRPFVGLKVAASLDGMMARQGDERAWITGARARQYGHFLRVAYDAIMIGRQTLVADDPILDARDSLVAGRAPHRIVVDPRGVGLSVFHDRGVLPRLAQYLQGGVSWVVREQVRHAADKRAALSWLEAKGVRIVTAPEDQHGKLDLAALLLLLRANGVQSLLLEGGAGLYGGFLEARLVDRLHLFQAPLLMGAHEALPFVGMTGKLGLRLEDVEITPLDGDWLVEGRYRPAPSAS